MPGPARIRIRSLHVEWLAALLWTVLVGALFYFSADHVQEMTREMALVTAREGFTKDANLRRWSSLHGGVYVPATELTPPNPHLAHLPDRDITKPDGTQLTLMNPAYMIRQFNELFATDTGARTHITSLRVLRPENAPDGWETRALHAFGHGKDEVVEFTPIDGEPHVRLMRPLYVQEHCLRCHGEQGYRVGDVRGGVSVALSLAPHLAEEREALASMAASFGGIWLLGLAAIAFVTAQFRRRDRERARVQGQLSHHAELLQTIVDCSVAGILLKNPEGRIEIASPSVAELLQLEPADFLGRRDEDLLPPRQAERVRALDLACVDEGRVIRTKETMPLPIGQRVLETTRIPLQGREGAVLVYIHDVTELEASIEEARRKVAELERFAEAAMGRELRIVELESELAAQRGNDLEDAPLPEELAAAATDAERHSALLSLAVDAARGRREAEEHRRAAEQNLARLEAVLEEQQRLNRAMLGRESRLLELKREVNELCVRLGEPRRFALHEADATTMLSSLPRKAER